MARSLGISEKRLLGWEPQEFHEFVFDDAGKQVGTVVSREAEWTDRERDKMQALIEYERHVCDCGLPESIANEDPDVQIEHRYCPICASLAVRGREQDAQDEAIVKRLGEKPSPSIPLPNDGRHVSHRLMAPDEVLSASSGKPAGSRGG